MVVHSFSTPIIAQFQIGAGDEIKNIFSSDLRRSERLRQSLEMLIIEKRSLITGVITTADVTMDTTATVETIAAGETAASSGNCNNSGNMVTTVETIATVEIVATVETVAQQ